MGMEMGMGMGMGMEIGMGMEMGILLWGFHIAVLVMCNVIGSLP